jgi:hypothetical protein
MKTILLAGLTGIGLWFLSPHPLTFAKPSLPVPDTTSRQSYCKTTPSSQPFTRTELFFGLSKPDDSEVTEAEFQRFLRREVTPRFPDGLTLLSGRGQFKGESGVIEKEPAKVLILLYPLGTASSSSQKVQQIRRVYKTAFQQESVLRTDALTCVSF